MLAFTLAMALAVAPQQCAGNCACPKPVVHHKHHRKLPAADPAQSCAVPPVPMCWREPEPDPDLQPLPTVVPYYVPAGTTDIVPYEVPPPQAMSCDDGDCYPPPTWIPPDGFVVYGEPWGVDPDMSSGPHMPPPDGRWPSSHPYCCDAAPHGAPEMDPGAGLGAVTLLLGALCIIRGRH